MSNLIPEIRTNKHGVPVKKYVRADPKAAISPSSLPAPLSAPASKHRLSAAQLQPRKRSLSSLKYESDKRLRSLRPFGGYEFVSSDAEMLDVMSVTDDANAFALMNLGVRTADEACDHLEELGADDLIKDRSSFTNKLLERGLLPENAADFLSNGQLRLRMSSDEMEASPYCADAVAFHSHGGLTHKDESYTSYFTARKLILEGNLRLADLKELGYERITRGAHLSTITEAVQRHAKGDANYSLSDLGALLDKMDAEGHNTGQDDARTKQAIKLLDRVGWDKVSKLDEMDSFILRYRKPADEADEPTAVDAAYYEAILAHGMERTAGQLAGRSGRYWASEYPGEARILREAGISTEDAIPLMADGKTAHETIGILNGVEAVIADGWL
jgi:hypothetical protein